MYSDRNPDWRLIEAGNKFDSAPTRGIFANPYYDEAALNIIDTELDRRAPNKIQEYDHSGNLIDKVMAGYDDDGMEVWV